MDTLTTTEKNQLEACETVIEYGLKTFVDVGNALMEIRDDRLYRAEFDTFENYCNTRWGLTRRHVNRTIAAAQVADHLGPMGPKPDNERQARPLTQLDPEQQAEAWQRAVETAPNGKPTAAHVSQVVDEIRFEHAAPHTNGIALTDEDTEPLPWDTEEVETPILLPKGGNKANRKTDPAEEGGMDFCQTPPYALLPLLPYLPPHWTLWEPARGEGYLEAALKDKDFSVVSSCILTGQDFFDYTPDGWDCVVTNPPYSIKYTWLRRCYELGKPFALLLPIETLGTQSGQYQFAEHGIEIILIDKRINFKMPEKGWEGSGSQFPTAWFTWGLDIGQQMTFERIDQAHLNAWKRQCEAEEMAPPMAA